MKNKLIKIFMLICTLIFLLCFSFGELACGESDKSYTEAEAKMVDCTLYRYDFAASAQLNILLYYEDKNAIFECKTDAGSFHIRNEEREIEKSFNSELFWVPYEMEKEEIANKELAYIDIILKVGSEIKGYAVIKIFANDRGICKATKIKSKIFTEEDLASGQMTNERVLELIEECKGDC